MSSASKYPFSYIDALKNPRQFREDRRRLIATFRPEDSEKAEKIIRGNTSGSIDGQKKIKARKLGQKTYEERVIKMTYLNKDTGFARITTTPGIAFDSTIKALTTGTAAEVVTAVMPGLIDGDVEQKGPKDYDAAVYCLPRRLSVQLKKEHYGDRYHYEKFEDEDGEEDEKLVFDEEYFEQATTIFKKYNLKIEKAYGKPGLFSVSFAKAENMSEVEQLITVLKERGFKDKYASEPELGEAKYVDVHGVSFDAALEPAGVEPNDPLFNNQWALKRLNPNFDINVDGILTNTTEGYESDIQVAVVDTGVDINHPELRVPGAGGWSRIMTKFSAINGGIAYADINDTTTDGHGTVVAGVIGAKTHDGSNIAGAAWDCGLFIVKISNENAMATVDHAIAKVGIDKVREKAYANRGAGGKRYVMNLSWKTWNDSSLRTEIQEAFNEGVVVVAAAGDDSPPVSIANAVWPADWSTEVIAAAAHMNSYNAQRRADSNRAPSTPPSNVVIAPGDSVHTTMNDGSIEERFGTSLAAGFVSSVAAHCWTKTYTVATGQFAGARTTVRDNIRNAILNPANLYPETGGGAGEALGRLNAQLIYNAI